MATPLGRHSTHVPAVRVEVEKSLGITQRSAPVNFAWTGDIRKRYTDFLVYEIAKDGSVTHLYDYPEPDAAATNNAGSDKAPQKPAPQSAKAPSTTTVEAEAISDENRAILVKLAGESVTKDLIELDEHIQTRKWNLLKGKAVPFPINDDRDVRRTIHQEVRRIFSSRLETVADAAGVITASQAKRGGGRRSDGGRNGPRQQGFEALGGEYLHLTLYKENKDTMDAINTIARLMKIKASNFAFAGTKDRRAATVQRISIGRQRSQNVIWLNNRLPGVKVGDFVHSKYPLSLGQHGGNEFVIVLKNCQPLGAEPCSLEQRIKKIQEAVEMGLSFLRARGYINYYGLQRFGTHAISTHVLGMKILSGDFEGVIDDILHVEDHLLEQVLNQGAQPSTSAPNDEFERARAITTWKMTKNVESALTHLPKRFSTESAIMRHLGAATHQRDFMGALLSITRGMRMMYIHAYQSYVWNHVASLRWSKYGTTVIAGDLVLMDNNGRSDGSDNDDVAMEEEEFYSRARHLTADDISSGKYTIADVVLPTPGFDVIYPNNDIGDFYKEFMARAENGSLNPFEMRRKQREFSLSGNYRTLLGYFITDPKYCIRTYTNDTEQMYPTDLDICTAKKAAHKAATEKKREQDRLDKTKNLPLWNHFASNPAEWDKALAAERRRKAESEEPSTDVTRTKETWVQTGLDERESKRVKLTRETFERIETPKTAKENEKSAAADPLVVNAENDIAGTDPGQVVPSLTAAVYGSHPGETATGISPGVKGLADLLSNGRSVQEPTGVSVTAEEDSATKESSTTEEAKPQTASDPLNWFGKNMPQVAAPESVVEAIEEAQSTVSDANHIQGVPVPALRTVSGNQLMALDSKSLSDEGIDTSKGGDKIAVVLKFQLKSSNYATVVLRELTGVPQDGSA